ncbi:FecR family protein [Dyadobacter sp. NIV53]|uniref:FecR family protein n=1 Tax=Dyadobacter sp. NIV53 TaxID=2861765 RepID=UPI001C87F4D0|nr:FecR domain-containing protein [Dyadobacter sp. NIV53]
MNNHENISEELLARYLAETTTETENIQVQFWLAESPDHEQELEAYRIIWKQSGISERTNIHVDTDAAWKKVRSKMHNTYVNIPEESFSDHIKPINSRQKTIQRKLPVTVWAAAVIALLLMALGWFLIRTEYSIPPSLQVATKNKNIEKILPDGTKVFLNYNSSLTYPEKFTGDLRTVSLKGEAFFDVKPDAEHPFVIDANGIEIKVLGTSFNIKAYEKEAVRVDVATGKVRIHNSGMELNLVKGQSAEADPDTIRQIIPDINMMGYRTQVFNFDATNLKDVVSSIRSGYHIDLRLSNTKSEQCRLTIRFEKEPVDATLSVIAETLDLKVRKEGETYWLDGSGCP